MTKKKVMIDFFLQNIIPHLPKKISGLYDDFEKFSHVKILTFDPFSGPNYEAKRAQKVQCTRTHHDLSTCEIWLNLVEPFSQNRVHKNWEIIKKKKKKHGNLNKDSA